MTPDAATIASKLTKARRTSAGWIACCPAHEDSSPSLSISDGNKGPVFKCHAGCSQESVLNAIEALGVQIRKVNGTNGRHHDDAPQTLLTLAALSAAKGISLATLQGNYVSDTDRGVAFQYVTQAGETAGTKIRKYLGGGAGGKGFSWARGRNDERPQLYGLWRLERDYANDNRVILCEGETDALTLWQHGYTALALPGASMWKDEWAEAIPEGAKVYVILEPDQGGRTVEAAIRKSPLKKRAWFIRMPEATKDPNSLHMASEAGFPDDFEKLIATAEPAVARRNQAIDWRTLNEQSPPERLWAINHWLGMGHVTLLSGAGGTGKTSVAQALSSCLALGHDYLDTVSQPRRILFWACEDDRDELWRRQLAIAAGLGVSLADFAGRLYLHSYDGEQVELAGLADGKLVASPMLHELNEQVGDYQADVIVLDNIARLYGGSENDRHQVTNFMAMLTGAAKATNAAVLLLGHPGKALGSEYSGSTAWEGSARARLYLGRHLPDKEPQAETEEADDGVRYLSRRKANYSTRDWRKITYKNGVMVPEDPADSAAGTTHPKHGTEFTQDTVRRAIRQLSGLGKFGNASTASPDYLPKLADQYKLLDGVSRTAFASTMRQMELAGTIKLVVVGKYQNRTPKMGYQVQLEGGV
jgi:RecA-family ATPase